MKKNVPKQTYSSKKALNVLHRWLDDNCFMFLLFCGLSSKNTGSVLFPLLSIFASFTGVVEVDAIGFS